MKQISDEVRDAQFEAWWEKSGQFCHTNGGAYEKTFAYTAWLAALDTAQPEQVNTMLLEALEAAEKLEHAALVALSEATYELKVGNTYTTATDTYKANNELIHRLDKILNLQYRDRKREARLAAQQAQPERAPMTQQQIEELAVEEELLLICDGLEEFVEIVRAVEKYHGIKQGGQHD